MKYFVYLHDCEHDSNPDVCILRDSGLENAIAFASYVFINSRQDILVLNENDLIVVQYTVV